MVTAQQAASFIVSCAVRGTVSGINKKEHLVLIYLH